MANEHYWGVDHLLYVYARTQNKMDFRPLGRLNDGLSLRGEYGAILFGSLIFLAESCQAAQQFSSISNRSHRTINSHE